MTTEQPVTAETPATGGAESAPAPATPAPDQTDRAILAGLEQHDGPLGCPCDVLVIDDATGALTAAALDAAAEHSDAVVVSWTSSYRRAHELAALFARQIADGRLRVPTGPEPVTLGEAATQAEAHAVIGRLPASLAALDAIARQVARAYPECGCALALGGRTKHMTPSQNAVLAESFEIVDAALGVAKSRALVAQEARTQIGPPAVAEHAMAIPVGGSERTIALRGIGGVFGSAAADAGSLLLLTALDENLSDRANAALDVVDLGSGNGLLSAWAAAAMPSARILATDDDADAVASTRATLHATAIDPQQWRATWDDAASREPDASADLVLLNPPFHDGTAIDPTLVQGLLDAAARLLRPGGELWFVHNSHLRYRTEVERRVGPVTQRARDRRFTVLSARRRADTRPGASR